MRLLSARDVGLSWPQNVVTRPLFPRVVLAWWLIGASYGSAIALMVAVALAADAKDLSFGYFSREPAAVLNGHWFVGFLSQVCVLALWSGAIAALLSATHARRQRNQKVTEALVVTGLFMAWLALDDAFQFHELVIPRHLGIPEEGVYAAYVLAGLAYAWRYLGFLRASPWPLLLSGAGFLGFMAAVDVATQQTGMHLFMLEDGAKLLGVVSLTAFVIWSSLRTVDR